MGGGRVSRASLKGRAGALKSTNPNSNPNPKPYPVSAIEPSIAKALSSAKAGGMTANEAYEAGYSPALIQPGGYTTKEVGALVAGLKADGLTAPQASA